MMNVISTTNRFLQRCLLLLALLGSAGLHAQVWPDDENFEQLVAEQLFQTEGVRHKTVTQGSGKQLVFMQSVPGQQNGTPWGYVGIPGDYFNGYPNKAMVFNYYKGTTDGSANPGAGGYGIYRMLFSETPRSVTGETIDTLAKLGNFRLKSIYVALGKNFGTEPTVPSTVLINFHALRNGVSLVRPFITMRAGTENSAAGSFPETGEPILTYSAMDKHGGRTFTFVSDEWGFIDGLWISTAGTARIPILIDNIEFEAPDPVPPIARSTNLAATDEQTHEVTLRWNNGGSQLERGNWRVLLVKETDSPTELPPSTVLASRSGEIPAAIPRRTSSPTGQGLDGEYGATGTDLGDGWYCIYNDSYSNFPLTVTGLSPGKRYRAVVADYHGAKGFQTFMDEPFMEGGNAISFATSGYPPVIVTSGGETTFTESANGDPVPVAIDESLALTDPDNATLASATVAITSNFQSGEDLLAFANNGTSMGNIGGSYDAGTGVLTLTSEDATATLAQWQAALRAVTYSNTSNTPNTASRTVSFTAHDGTAESTSATKTVAVTAVNNPPVVSNLHGDAVMFTEKGSAILLDAGGDATVTDPDSDDFDGGNLTVSIVANGIPNEDRIGIRNEGTATGDIGILGNDIQYGGTTIGSFTGGTAGDPLVVDFLPAATPEAAQALIRNLTYSNSNTADPTVGERTIRVVLDDGDGATSLPSEVTVGITAVNDAPTVTTSGGENAFSEVADNDPVPLVIDAGLTVSDPDNATLASATVSITGNFQADQDLLALIANEETMGNIVGAYDAGVLTLTSEGATATLAQWQAALRAVTYTNTSKAPNTDDRTIVFDVHDGLEGSQPATKTVTVADANDTPVIGLPEYIEVQENSVTAVVGISFSDVDAGDGVVKATFSIADGRGELQAVSAAGVDVTPTGSHTVELEGTLAALNAYLEAGALTFAPVPDDVEEVMLAVSINDNGHTGGDGTARQADSQLPIRVKPIVPNVTGVSSSSEDGRYGMGSTVEITVAFDHAVNVTGAPELLLETGETDRPAIYQSGSGSDILVFSYTVQAMDESDDLEYVSTDALSLNGGAIRSAAGTDADLTLPAPFSNGSLGADKAIAIDGVAPAVPTGFAVLAGDAEVTLGWTANTETDLLGYRIYSGETASPTTPLATVDKGMTTYLHTGLTNGTRYHYRIAAVDETGNESAFSEDVRATPVAEQTITFEPLAAATYGDSPITLVATASSGLPVSFVSDDDAVAEVFEEGNNWKIRVLRAGTVTITATQAGNAAFVAAEPVDRELVIRKATPVISADAVQTHVFDGTDKRVTASVVPSELAGFLQYSPRGSFTEVGEHRVRVYLNERADYLAAEAWVDFSITPAAQHGLFLRDLTVTYDGRPHALEVDGLPAGASVSYTMDGEPGNSAVDAGSYEVTAIVSRANHADEALRATLTINRAQAFILGEERQVHVYDGTPKSLDLALSHGEADLDYSPGSRFVEAGTYTIVVSAPQTGNYEAVSKTFTLRIERRTARSIDFPALPAKTYGDADFDAGATASTEEPVSYTSSDASVAEVTSAGLIRITGAGEAVITATVPENGNYANRPAVSRTLVVRKAPQAIILSAPAEVNRDAGSITLTATATSGLPVSVSIDDPDVATLEGMQLRIRRLGTVRVTAVQEGDTNHEPAEPQTIAVRVVDPSSDFPVRVSKAVSPNGDGINEYLIIEAIKDHPDNRVTVFNRNGTVVYEASGYNNGTVAFRGIGTGQHRVPAGTYFYVAEIKVNGKWEYDKGWFVLRY